MPAAPYTVRSRGLRAERVELRVQSGRKIIAQGKRSAALGNEAIMNIGVGGWSPRAAVAPLLCPGLFSPASPGRQTEPPGSATTALTTKFPEQTGCGGPLECVSVPMRESVARGR